VQDLDDQVGNLTTMVVDLNGIERELHARVIGLEQRVERLSREAMLAYTFTGIMGLGMTIVVILLILERFGGPRYQ
jgi:hypothetical protein